MKKPNFTPIHFLLLILIIFTGMQRANADDTTSGDMLPTLNKQQPGIIPDAPNLNAQAYLLIDANSGKILVEQNADERRTPASLTKMMTMYVASIALKSGQINLADKVRVSRKAWQTGGSKMFVREGQLVTVEDLVRGVIIDSGNDASIALAEYIAGSEKSFVDLMNQQAQVLGMNNTQFADSTGLKSEDQYSTARDMAVLARALVLNFPDHYAWYKEKWFTFNGIKQANRNRLLWRDNTVDGIKTGHTDKAGYCLVSSSVKDNMRLIGVLMGSPNDSVRADASQRLLNFGYRFYETTRLYQPKQSISDVQVWQGNKDKIAVGVANDVYITIPRGTYKQLNINVETNPYLTAPIKQGDNLGKVVIKLNDNIITEQPVIALSDVPVGGWWTRMKDSVRLATKRWFAGDNDEKA